ncbi:MAG: hypothetical protein Q7S96_03325 [bacterium]|nr:hypothetical protein [bacterium]
MTLRHALTFALVLVGLVTCTTVFARIPVLAHLPLAAVVAFFLCVRCTPPLRLMVSVAVVALVLDVALAHPMGVRALLLLAALLLTTPLRIALRSRYHLGIALLLAIVLAFAEYLALVLPTLVAGGGGWITILRGAMLAIGTMTVFALLLRPRVRRMIL